MQNKPIVNNLKYWITSLLLLLLIMTASQSVTLAQRGITYENLVNRQQTQHIFLDYFTLPSSEPGKVTFVSTFRIDYSFLPFKKMNSSEENPKFFSPTTLSIEIFRTEDGHKKSRDEFSVKGLEPADRAIWRDTAYAETYEQTQSQKLFIEGKLQVDLPPGSYSYFLQLARGEGSGEQRSRQRTFTILPYSEKKQGNIIFAEQVTNQQNHHNARLLNYGNSAYYGSDFWLIAHMPGHQSNHRYQVEVERMKIQHRDTTTDRSVYSSRIDPSEIILSEQPSLTEQDNDLNLEFREGSEGEAYLIHKIPNGGFVNDLYRITIRRSGSDKPIARTFFRSRWNDMPVSLLNLNVAIDMLRFIVDSKQLKRIRSGSDREKEEKFREFWSQRDPTPDTEYNELMAEYYRRIDDAYERFTTLNQSGFETDRGKIFIKYGPPKNIERRFPSGKPAVEVWTYSNNQQFVFRATSGFGDFELVQNSK